MKVLFPLHLFYPSRIGGPANTIYWLCKALAKKGHSVNVVATRMGIDEGCVKLDEWVHLDGFNVRYCNTSAKLSMAVIRYSLSRLRDVDTVVLSSICLLQNSIIALCAKLLKKRIVWSPRGELFDSAVQGNKGKIAYFSLLRIFLSKSILFHATSEAEKVSIRSYFPNSEIVIIPNYMELPKREFVDSTYSDFIYVGRISPIKALDRLIDGLALSQSFLTSHYRFLIVGVVQNQFYGYYQDLLKRIEDSGLKDKVEFVGSLAGEEKFRAFASARYSFLVSKSENFGNVVIEALSQGTPVVASKGTPWAVLPEAHAGFWIDNTPEMIADTIDTLISQSDEEYMQYRVGALNLSKSFDVYDHISEWESILR